MLDVTYGSLCDTPGVDLGLLAMIPVVEPNSEPELTIDPDN